MGAHRLGRALMALACICGPWVAGVRAEDGSDPLPEPLTLDAALARADSAHPDVLGSQARLDQARADLMAAESAGALNVNLEGRARWVEPQERFEELGRDDHKASLVVQRNIYDFGRSSALETAAQAQIRASNWRYLNTVAQRRVRIMEAYFDVLLADLQFARDNEAMAVAFIDLDKLRDRRELGQVSDIELLAAESEYQRIRRERAQSLNRQRIARARLASLLDVPGQLPSNLVEPELPQLERQVPGFDEAWSRIEEKNPYLNALRAELASARERVAAARAAGRPLLNGELEASAYSRELGSNDVWRAGVNLRVPLYTGGSVDAAVARETAELNGVRALLREAEYDLRQQVLELVMQLQTYDERQDESWAQQDYRELYLDRSRAIYEMEVKTDLGDAMVRLTEAEITAARTRYETAAAWERLDALAGGGPVEQNQEGGDAQ